MYTLQRFGLLLLLGAPSVAQGQVFEFELSFDDPFVGQVNPFGAAVSFTDEWVLVGEPMEHSPGMAHLFNARTGALQRTFRDPTGSSGDMFGASVVLQNNVALIGTPRDNTLGPYVGQAHLFDVGTGALLQTFDMPDFDSSVELFGQSLAMFDNKILIGAPAGHGRAYLFDANNGDLIRFLSIPANVQYFRFGHSVALDGRHIVIGDPYASVNGVQQGLVHLYDSNSGDFVRSIQYPGRFRFPSFGESVSIYGDYLLVGAPSGATTDAFPPPRDPGQAFLFDLITGDLLQVFDDPMETTYDRFGDSVELVDHFAVIGSPEDDTGDSNSGNVFVFDSFSGQILQTISGLDSHVGMRFGYDLAFDGKQLLIGSRSSFRFSEVTMYRLIPEPATWQLLFIGSVAGALWTHFKRRTISST